MRRGLLLPAVAATALLLTGCAPTISLRPAPQATSVGCAGVIVRLPDTIGGAARRDTDAQGTAAWGNPVGATLTCGVLTPEASDINCVTFGSVDWLTQSRRIDGTDWNVYTTFGRTPGTQVLVDPQTLSTDAVLNDLADPIAAATKVTAQCLSLSSTR
ncbi:DUF3515 family protein [Amnibacterium kyonggiense]|uniref:Uncharacterized protein DUF3515 n=1 Tax=Amnibacterium kyonggiense TaxID=595671 RepID=A0A4R7FSN8_9MICO|nr:DUF3515 family protein [Amnibacterium kyonggiense]TDS80863.1 uncharacterized protein DUF3515 [Amnibacterium kyonggiense]